MSKENKELLESMVGSLVQDVLYQFDLDREEQAVKLIKKVLEKKWQEIKSVA